MVLPRYLPGISNSSCQKLALHFPRLNLWPSANPNLTEWHQHPLNWKQTNKQNLGDIFNSFLSAPKTNQTSILSSKYVYVHLLLSITTNTTLINAAIIFYLHSHQNLLTNHPAFHLIDLYILHVIGQSELTKMWTDCVALLRHSDPKNYISKVISKIYCYKGTITHYWQGIFAETNVCGLDMSPVKNVIIMFESYLEIRSFESASNYVIFWP